MQPGSYYIVVNKTGRMTAAAPFKTLYYPGTHDQSQATIVTVAAGQQISNIDIRVPALAPTIQLRGRALFSNGILLEHFLT
jgi:hypothetical protein